MDAAVEPKRVVLLGASNLSLGWPQLMQVISARLKGPTQVLTAHGFGRSYLRASLAGWRTAPGILESGLWQQLHLPSCSPPVAALLTDLGNDLVYGSSADQLLQAAEEAISRLKHSNPHCEIVVTRPPLDSVRTLSELRFRLFRTIIFPACRLSLQTLLTETEKLDLGVRQLPVTVVPQEKHWFGVDPIHLKRSCRLPAFESFLETWPKEPGSGTETADIPRKRPVMQERWVLGRRRQVPQPSVNGPGGSVWAS